MRITGGHHRGRKLDAPKGSAVRPTADKVRLALFNILLKYGLPDGAAVLDIFCGTGALGLDALSRGASSCVFVDSSNDSLSSCRANIATLKLHGCAHVLRRDAAKIGVPIPAIAPAALAFLDPPYRKDLIMPALCALHENGWLSEGAVIVAESEKELSPALPENFALLESRDYGDTRITIARYK